MLNAKLKEKYHKGARIDVMLELSEKEHISLGECLKSLSDRSLLRINAGISFQATARTRPTLHQISYRC